MTIKYYIKNVYGQKLKYIAGKEHQQKLASFTQNNYLSPQLEQGLKELGHKFKRVLTPI